MKSPKYCKSALSIRELSYSIGDRSILHIGNLDIEEGEFVSIFGPNGGGKTTLFHLILGFLRSRKGVIQILGKDILEVRRRIGYMPQHFRPDPLFPISVQEVVCLGNAKGREALERVGMESFSEAAFGSLSAGETARVLLARALAGEPSLLLLDEPAANLDPLSRERLYELLAAVKGEMTILMITHDLEEAQRLSDRLFCVQHQVVEYPKTALCSHFQQGLYHQVWK